MVSEPNEFRFPGQMQDGETDLYYNWNRYFEPRTGRYLMADPGSSSDASNRYVYALNNPLRLWDENGLRVYSKHETDSILIVAAQWDFVTAAEKVTGECDFKHTHPTDTFDIGGRLVAADEFGNYVAGYAGAQEGGLFGWIGVSLAGVFYSLFDPVAVAFQKAMGNTIDPEDLKPTFDSDSVEMIDLGALRGARENPMMLWRPELILYVNALKALSCSCNRR